MENKKGTLPTWVIALIALAISAIVLFIFLEMIINRDDNRIEACKTQIMYRHTLKELGKRAIPLTACKAEHICFVTSNKEECQLFEGGGEVNKVKIKGKREIFATFAEKMYECWYMTGEGNLDYYPTTRWSHTYCGACAKIGFSPEVRAEIENINYGEYYSYLETETTEGSDETYSEFLYGLSSMDTYRQQIIEATKASEDIEEVDIYNVELINPNMDYAVVTGVMKTGLAPKIIGGLIIGLIAGSAIPTGGLTLALVATGVGVAGGSGGFRAISYVQGKKTTYLLPEIFVYNTYLDEDEGKDDLMKEEMECDSFEFLP